MVLKNDSVVKLGQLKNLESLDLSGDNVTAPGQSALVTSSSYYILHIKHNFVVVESVSN